MVTRISTIAAISLLAALAAGCASPDAAPRFASAPTPAEPAPYLNPVACDSWRAGENVYVIAERERLCKERANLIIACEREEQARARRGDPAPGRPECLPVQGQ